MKKVLSVVLAMAVMLALVGCEKTKNPQTLLDDTEELTSEIVGKSQDEVHKLLGEPSGKLFGFWGEVYYNSDKQEIVLYYDTNGTVENVVVRMDKPTDTETKRFQ